MAKAPHPVEVVQAAGIAAGKKYPKEVLKVGQKMMSDDPRFKDHPAHFMTVEEVVQRDIERATARPGERRVVKPRENQPDRNATNKAPGQAAATKAKKANKEKKPDAPKKKAAAKK